MSNDNSLKNENDYPKRRSIRSFVKRAGKITSGQLAAMDELWPSCGVELNNQILDMHALFGREAPTVVEIGFGNGLSLAEMAEAAPENDYLGIEVHDPGVGSLLVQVKRRELTNVRVSKSDAVEVFAQQIADASLDRIQIFFPDPWHKKRHHKRRLIQPDFVGVLVGKLVEGGALHVATDWENYAEHILEVLEGNDSLENTADGYAPRPDYRPITKYETRGIRLGHGVWDVIFTKKANG